MHSLMLTLALFAAAPADLPARTIKLPHEAVAMAWDDLANPILNPPEVHAVTRYVWLRDTSPEEHAMLSLGINTTLNQSTRLVHCEKAAGGNLIKLRLDLLAPQLDDFKRIAALWETMFDPAFHVQSVIPGKLVKVAPYRHANGRTYTTRWETPATKITQFGVATNHDNDEAMVKLSTATRSSVPIIEARRLLRLLLTTLNGGMYYDFMGFKSKPKGSKQTDQEFVLSLAGASQEQIANRRHDERTAVWFSGVTAKPRYAEFFFGTVRPSDGYPLITLTHDIRDKDVTPETNPIKSLLNPKDAARELIFQRSNGTLAYALFDGNGKLQDVVPPDIAMDHNIPAPATGNLEPPLSCIVCHGPHDGRQPFPNDIQAMLRQRHGNNPAQFFGDDGATADPVDTLDRLAGLYTGDLSEPLRLARNAFEQSCYKIASRAGLECEPASYAKTLAKLAEVRMHKYLYRSFSPQDACYRLGYEANEEESAELFRQLIPAIPVNRLGIYLEDPTAMALRASTKDHRLVIRNDEFDFVYQDFLLRMLSGEVVRAK